MSPFEQVVQLIGTEYTPVTIGMLDSIAKIYRLSGLELQTMGQVFDSLEYLSNNGVIDMIPDSQDKNKFLVRSIYGQQ